MVERRGGGGGVGLCLVGRGMRVGGCGRGGIGWVWCLRREVEVWVVLEWMRVVGSGRGELDGVSRAVAVRRRDGSLVEAALSYWAQ